MTWHIDLDKRTAINPQRTYPLVKFGINSKYETSNASGSRNYEFLRVKSKGTRMGSYALQPSC